MAAHKTAFAAANHSREAELQDLTASVEANFVRLDAAFASRLTRLEQALAFRRFEASVKEEDAWIRERARNAASHMLGDSVTATDGLLAKHQVSTCAVLPTSTLHTRSLPCAPPPTHTHTYPRTHAPTRPHTHIRTQAQTLIQSTYHTCA
jgi:hypothetical protein